MCTIIGCLALPDMFYINQTIKPRKNLFMKKILKWAGIIIVCLAIALVLTVWVKQYTKYDAPYPANIHASADSALIARGKYLVTGPAHCIECHTPDSAYPLVEQGQFVNLSGGKTFNLPIGIIHTPNLTSDKETGLGNWPDSVIARSLRHGVGYDGKALFAFMPFQNMSDEDLTAVISYIRTLPPVKNKVPRKKLNPMGFVATAFFIKPMGPEGTPAQTVKPDTTAAYGSYLANYVANCKGCHTNRDLKTGAFTGKFFAGGFHLESVTDPDHFECVSPNITPDAKTGIMVKWSQADFLKRFRLGKVIPHSAMPWGPYKNMSDDELKALYNYLQTITPVENNPGPSLVPKK
jgi:mono/diheme cytochrome c family protein